MAGSVNKVILIGNVGNDPEIRSMQSGDKVANISLATSESWKDKNSGEKREKTEWHRVVVFGKLADIVERYVSKGSKLYIEGTLETRSWEAQDGQKKYSTEIVLRGFNSTLAMLDGKQGGGAAPYSEKQDQFESNGGSQTTAYDAEDEIPF